LGAKISGNSRGQAAFRCCSCENAAGSTQGRPPPLRIHARGCPPGQCGAAPSDRANEDQIHSALVGASRHETMICRKALPPWEYGSARESVPILSKGRRRVHQHRLRRDRRWSRIVRTRDGPMKGSNSETGTAETKMPPLGRPTVWWEALVTCSWSRPQPAAT